VPARASHRLFALSVLLSAGCAEVPSSTVQTFRSAPATWRTLRGSAPAPSDLKVERSHLDLAGDAAFVDGLELEDVALIADVAFVGGDPRGIAGIFIFDAASNPATCVCLAVRPGGQWRVYRSNDPLEPSGGRGWKALARSTPTGFIRLALRGQPGDLRLFVDGAEVEGLTGDAAPGGAAAQAKHPRFRVGLFNRAATSRWKNFIAGRALPAGSFRAEEHADWGSSSDADGNLREAREAAQDAARRPARMKLYAVAAGFEEAYRAFHGASNLARATETLELAARAASDCAPGARDIGEADLHRQAFRSLGKLGDGGRRGEERLSGLEGNAAARIEAARNHRKPLGLSLVVDGPPARPSAKPLLAPLDVTEVVRALYGGLERAEAGELQIRIHIERADDSEETSSSQRRVPVSRRIGGQLAALEAELKSLEKKLADDTLDARTRADVLRAVGTLVGPSPLRTFRIGGKTLELCGDDGVALERMERRVAELRAQVAKEGSDERLEYRPIPATLHASSILVEITCSVTLDQKLILETARERTYLGVEQWTHAESQATGTPASRFDPAIVEEARREVRSRALARLRTSISRESIVAKLPASERLDFLVRLARATREDDDIARLQWYLRSELGVDGPSLSKVAQSLLGPER